MTLNNRHQQCHPEVNLVLRIYLSNPQRCYKTGWWWWWGGGQVQKWTGMQASSILIISSISALPALVTSEACSHAARCLPWIMETALRPARSSPLNSPPHQPSDTLRPRRDSFTLTHTGTMMPGISGGDASSQRAPITKQKGGRSQPLVRRKHNPLTWIEISEAKSVT